MYLLAAGLATPGFTKVEKTSAVVQRRVQEYLEATTRLEELNEAASV